ncbi:Hsp20/alpha crystallin family protein [Bacillus sp. REN10]|uniref:Hsp20/alpha crystallin family protein n=1 Tax=Bacillus sp. REN10 TaxID=2782541 RepID=UPI00193C72CD|nr:Hsp20/alpha crystallin family protein [Bacillus sp. REN10]
MFPFQSPFSTNEEWQKWMKQFNQGDIEKYVQNVLTQSLPDAMQKHQESFDFLKQTPFSPFANQQPINTSPEKETPTIHISVFETHEDVYVKIPLEDTSMFSNLKIYHTSNQAIIEGIPEAEDKKIVILPAIVKKKGAVAHFKDGILQIKIPKEIDLQYTEIDVPDLE